MAKGEIESVTIGRSRRVPSAALAAYLDRLRASQLRSGQGGVSQ